jgi:hypothetical protein
MAKYKVYLCKECNKRRHVYHIASFTKDGKHYKKYRCSKGHIWDNWVGPIGEIINIEIERILPKIKDLFERDDTFFAKLKR